MKVLDIRVEKARAFGRAASMINELRDVISSALKSFQHLQTADLESQHIVRWFAMSGSEDENCTVLRYV